MSDCVLLNVATGDYVRWQRRLMNSLGAVKFPYAAKFWTNELPPSSPQHSDQPYGFKLFAIKWAVEQGYKNILWIDSGLWAIRPVAPIFEAIARDGYYMTRDENKVATYCSDEALRWHGVTREAMRHVHLASGALVGICPGSDAGAQVWAWWLAAYEAGLYRGTVSKHSGQEDHRGDESILGMLAHRYILRMHTHHDHFCADGNVGPTSIFRSGYYDRND